MSRQVDAEPQLVLIGGGEHARVVLDAVRSGAVPLRVTGFTDPRPRPELQELGLRWLGDDATAATELGGRACIIAVGGSPDTKLRQRIGRDFASSDVTWATVIHAAATVAGTAAVGAGVAVLAGAVINAGARIDDHAIVNTGAIVEHDVTVGAFAHLGPGSIVGGGASIGRGAFVGLGARIRDHVRIGADALIGMGAVVVDDVPDGATFVGVPARDITDEARRGDEGRYDGLRHE